MAKSGKKDVKGHGKVNPTNLGDSSQGERGREEGLARKRARHSHGAAHIEAVKRNDDQVPLLNGVAGLYCVTEVKSTCAVNCEVFYYNGHTPSVRLTDGFGMGIPLSYLISQDDAQNIKHPNPEVEKKWQELFSKIQPFLDKELVLAKREAYKNEKREQRVAEYADQKAKWESEGRAAQVAAIISRAKTGRDAAMAISGSKRGEYNIGDTVADYVLVSVEADLKNGTESVLKVIAVGEKSPLNGKVIPGKTFLKMYLLAKPELPNNPAIQQDIWAATDALHKFVHAFAAKHGIRARPESKLPKNVLPFKKAA